MNKNIKTFPYSFFFSVVFFVFLLIPVHKFDVPLKNLDQNFYGRDYLITKAADFRVLIGDQVYSGAVIGKDGWIIYTGELSADDYQNSIPFSEKELARIQQELDVLNKKYVEQGITLLVVVAPNKNTIYPEYVPEEIPVLGDEPRLDQLMRYMNKYGETEILDLRDTLLDGKKNKEVYYQTDTHWNSYGAYIGYREVLARLNFFYPELQPYPLSSFQENEALGQTRDLTKMIGTTLISEDSINLVHTSEVEMEDRIVPTADTLRNLLFSSNISDESLPHAVIFHDSFFESIKPYLKEHFSNVVFIPHYTVDSDLRWVKEQNPDIVIIEYTERYIHSIIDLLETEQ